MQVGDFSVEFFSEMGAPSYFVVFCRRADTDIVAQPFIRSLSVTCETTKKKSNVMRNISAGQLYHLTQRNVHAGAQYDRHAYDERQTIMVSCEDVGLMGIDTEEYQTPKRVTYSFSGTTNMAGNLFVLYVYNNRGLHVDGKYLRVHNIV